MKTKDNEKCLERSQRKRQYDIYGTVIQVTVHFSSEIMEALK